MVPLLERGEQAGMCHHLGPVECPSCLSHHRGLPLGSGAARRGEQDGDRSVSRQTSANWETLEMEGILAN